MIPIPGNEVRYSHSHTMIQVSDETAVAERPVAQKEALNILVPFYSPTGPSGIHKLNGNYAYSDTLTVFGKPNTDIHGPMYSALMEHLQAGGVATGIKMPYPTKAYTEVAGTDGGGTLEFSLVYGTKIDPANNSTSWFTSTDLSAVQAAAQTSHSGTTILAGIECNGYDGVGDFFSFYDYNDEFRTWFIDISNGGTKPAALSPNIEGLMLINVRLSEPSTPMGGNIVFMEGQPFENHNFAVTPSNGEIPYDTPVSVNMFFEAIVYNSVDLAVAGGEAGFGGLNIDGEDNSILEGMWGISTKEGTTVANPYIVPLMEDGEIVRVNVSGYSDWKHADSFGFVPDGSYTIDEFVNLLTPNVPTDLFAWFDTNGNPTQAVDDVVSALSGKYEFIYDLYESPFDAIIDYGYPDAVKTAMSNLCSKRIDTVALINAPVNFKTLTDMKDWGAGHFYNSPRTFKLMENVSILDNTITDYVRRPLSQLITTNIHDWFTNAMTGSLATERNARISGATDSTIRPTAILPQEKSDISDVGLNFTTRGGVGYKLDRQLADVTGDRSTYHMLHNQLIIGRMIKDLHNYMELKRHVVEDNGGSLRDIEAGANDILSKYKEVVLEASFTCVFANEYDKGMGITTDTLRLQLANSTQIHKINIKVI